MIEIRWRPGKRRHATPFQERVALGDRARASGDWPTAAARYKEALKLDPLAAPIWVQFGHAVKEQGLYDQGEDAYRIALAINSQDADAHLQLGHALKLQGKYHDAAEAYAAAAASSDPVAESARAELQALKDRETGAERDRLAAAIAELEQRMNERFGAEVKAALHREFDLGLNGSSLLTDLLGGLWDNFSQLQSQVQGCVEAIHSLSASRIDSRQMLGLSDGLKEATARIETLVEQGNRAVTSLGDITEHVSVVEKRLTELATKDSAAFARLVAIEEQQGSAMSSFTELAARLTAVEQLRATSDQTIADNERVQAHLGDLSGRLDELSRDKVHLGDLEALRSRVEFIRRELMYEFRAAVLDQGRPKHSPPRPKILNTNKVVQALGQDMLRLNIGCGHIPKQEYVNVDVRELPGVDVIADVTDLPFHDESVSEIYSSHLLEHFSEEILRRVVLPHWRKKLRPGGVLRTIVPDASAMIRAYVDGQMPFQDLRDVTFGGQDYAGDYHYTMFTTDHIRNLLSELGFRDLVITAEDRTNGTCREFEIVGVRGQ